MEDDKVALVDMDGTVADFESALLEGLEAMRSPDEPPLTPELIWEEPPWLKARMRAVKARPGFWRALRPFEDGLRVVGHMEEVGFRVHVLTRGPKWHPLAWREKVEWCEEHLPGRDVTVTRDKSLAYGRVLFDDWVPYVEGWLKWRPRGLVVMPDWTHNAGFSHPNVLRYRYRTSNPLFELEQDGGLVNRLRAAFERESGSA